MNHKNNYSSSDLSRWDKSDHIFWVVGIRAFIQHPTRKPKKNFFFTCEQKCHFLKFCMLILLLDFERSPITEKLSFAVMKNISKYWCSPDYSYLNSKYFPPLWHSESFFQLMNVWSKRNLARTIILPLLYYFFVRIFEEEPFNSSVDIIDKNDN